MKIKNWYKLVEHQYKNALKDANQDTYDMPEELWTCSIDDQQHTYTIVALYNYGKHYNKKRGGWAVKLARIRTRRTIKPPKKFFIHGRESNEYRKKKILREKNAWGSTTTLRESYVQFTSKKAAMDFATKFMKDHPRG